VNRSPWVRAGALALAVTLLLATGLAFASVLTGGGTGSSSDNASLRLEPTTTTTLSAAQQALAARLPDGPLDGMTRSEADLGPLTVDTAAEEYPFGDPSGGRLRDAGFVQGFSRGWEGADGRSAHLLVFEMKDPAAFMRSWSAAAEAIAKGHFPTPVGDGISDIEGPAGGPAETEDSIVAWVDGSYWYYVAHFGPAGGTGPDHARTIVAAVQAR
jgi:hypothetical protein